MVGSLYIPETAKRKSDQGVIIYKGDDVEELKVGDHVLFSAYSGTQISVAEEGHYLIMPESEVVAVLGEGERVFTQKDIESAIDKVWYSGRDWGDVAFDFATEVLEHLSSAEIRAMEN
jgi:chaperonin GroES